MNSLSGTGNATKQTWLILLFAFTFGVVLYGAVGAVLSQSRERAPLAEGAPTASSSRLTAGRRAENQTLRAALALPAVGALAASMALFHFQTRRAVERRTVQTPNAPPLLTPAQFQTVSVMALALSEACAIFGLIGFSLGGTLQEFLLFALGTILVNLLFLLPRGLAYWSAWEQTLS